MSTRTRIAPTPVITNGAMASNITSAVTILGNCVGLSYGVSWAAGSTPVGTLQVQASNDYQLSLDGKTVVNAGTWNTLSLEVNGTIVQSITVSGNTGNAMIDIQSTQVYALRLVYTASSGSGTMQATATGRVS